MRPSVLLQIIFLAMLGLFVAVNSSDRLENSWEAARIRQECINAGRVGGEDLITFEKQTLETACDRLLWQLNKWRTNLAASNQIPDEINFQHFRDILNQSGEQLVNDALESCIMESMIRIRQEDNPTGGILARTEALFDLYRRIKGFTEIQELDYKNFQQLLDLLDYERRLLAEIEAATTPSP